MKKREISDIEKEECRLLKQLFNDKKKELGLSQAKIAGLIGVTQAAINHYLNGTNALNASIASEFAKVLGVPVGSFSWRLEKEINEMSNSLIISGGVIISKPTKEELSDADKHFLKSMPLLDIDIAVRHLANPDKDRAQIQGDGDRAATFIPHSGHTVGVRMADDVEFAGIKRGDILIVEPHIPPRDKDLVLICIDNTGYLRGMVGRLSIAIDGTHTIIYDGGSGVPLPDGAFIAGVVVEVKRRLIPTDILLSRLDPDYNIHQSKQR